MKLKGRKAKNYATINKLKLNLVDNNIILYYILHNLT